MTPHNEIYISVDVETAGPNPGRYSLLSIGACLVDNTSENFYAELQPISPDATPEALEICGFSMADLQVAGLPPAEAMLEFAGWVERVVPAGKQPVFVAFNAPFDWSFVNEYFHRFLGYNPFGHSAIDIKAYYMGMTGALWAQTSLSQATARLGGAPELSHNALEDAIDQGTLFKTMLELPKCVEKS